LKEPLDDEILHAPAVVDSDRIRIQTDVVVQF